MGNVLTKPSASSNSGPVSEAISVAGWERCSPDVVISALRLIALAAQAHVCTLTWPQVREDEPDALDAGKKILIEQRRPALDQNRIPDFSATVCISLSPRPERLTSRILSFGSVVASLAA